ncbi:hypothetical protein F2P81_001327 [Scophthalmus maximus]|uniref:Endonuclease/exonuclease/phosphatase domain-containing protein n=1 Tax=Scophthalmus maximus TaxID=52904 RepID=A0A6A4TX09_SCOMX|nr:hypothetical protein F2P81_001327 [Scophthalmus maximus]
MDTTNLTILNNDEPTHIHSAYSTMDILDLALSSPDLSATLQNFTVSHDIGSDHLPILATFSRSLQHIPQKPRYNYRKANLENYRNHIDKQTTDITQIPQDHHSLDHLATHIGSILTQARASCIPLHTTCKPLQQLPPHILHLIKRKRKIRRHYFKYRSPDTKAEINQLRNQIKQQLTLRTQDKWKSFYNKLDSDYRSNPHSFWQKIKSMNGAQNKNNIPTLIHQSQTIENNQEKSKPLQKSTPKHPLLSLRSIL